MAALVAGQVAQRSLVFSSKLDDLNDLDLCWLTIDAPVAVGDSGDIRVVVNAFESVMPHLRDEAVMVVSSQVPVGTCAALRAVLEVHDTNSQA